MADLTKISKDGKFFFLSYDHGLSCGPTEFTLSTANPQYVFDLTKSGLFTGIITHKGIAEKYYTAEYFKTPLLIMLNGKATTSDNTSPSLLCTVEEAARLRAKGVVYTILPGDLHEQKMFKEMGQIVYEAHDIGLPVITWIVSPESFNEQEKTERIAYAARLGLELGADIIRVAYTGTPESMSWVCACAGKIPVCIAGGLYTNKETLTENIQGAMEAGCKGVCFGRNIWQDDTPLERAKEFATYIFS